MPGPAGVSKSKLVLQIFPLHLGALPIRPREGTNRAKLVADEGTDWSYENSLGACCHATAAVCPTDPSW